jgi:hypothetical protein
MFLVDSHSMLPFQYNIIVTYFKSNIPTYFLWLLPCQGELGGDSGFLSSLGTRLTLVRVTHALDRYIKFFRQQNNKTGGDKNFFRRSTNIANFRNAGNYEYTKQSKILNLLWNCYPIYMPSILISYSRC